MVVPGVPEPVPRTMHEHDEIFTVRAVGRSVSASLSALPTPPLSYTYSFSYAQIRKLQERGDVMHRLGFGDPPLILEEVTGSPGKSGTV